MHEIDYLLEQFQHHAYRDWSAKAGPFFAWLQRFLIARWLEGAAPSLPEGVSLPERPADGLWTETPSQEPGTGRQVEWWLEAETIIGTMRDVESADKVALFSYYRFPCTSLALFRLVTWYGEQYQPQPTPLMQPVLVLATAWAPDCAAPHQEVGYALVQRGDFQYVLHAAQTSRPTEADYWLDHLPVTVLQRRSLQRIPPESYANEHGQLCFDDRTHAMSWFLDWITHAGGALLLSTDLSTALAPAAPRPRLPDLETMQRYQSDLRMDHSMRLLTETQRQERLAFLMQGGAQIRQAFPPATLQALTRDIERILEDVQAKRAHTQGESEAQN